MIEDCEKDQTRKIACIGGGTGLHAELSGLKEVFKDDSLAAVVTMMDSGSNSGKLRDEHLSIQNNRSR